jgi:hypothetical protein
MRLPLFPQAVLLATALLAGCAPKVLSPKPPKGVPATATWVDGAGGGSWVDCHKLAGELPQFDCSIYSARGGSIYARGVFAADFDPSKSPLHFTAYDGGGRITISDTTHLRAEGPVDFPSGDGHGHVLKYSVGTPAGRDSTY